MLNSVYREFRGFSRSRITRYAQDATGESVLYDEDSNTVFRDVLSRVWLVTRDKSAVELSEITHCQDSAWDKAFQNYQSVLSNDDIAKDETYRELRGLS